MTKSAGHWRQPLFRSAVVLFLINIATNLSGVVIVNMLDSIDAKLRAGAWLFLAGGVLSLLTFSLSFFGTGMRRAGLASASLLALPFW